MSNENQLNNENSKDAVVNNSSEINPNLNHNAPIIGPGGRLKYKSMIDVESLGREHEILRGDQRLNLPPKFAGFGIGPNEGALSIPDLHKYTIPHSPYHITQLCMLLLKDFFNDGLPEAYNWKYDKDFNKSKILFDSSFNKESEAFGKKPIIVVTSGDLSYSRVLIGDNATFNTNPLTGAKSIQKTGFSQTTLLCYVISKKSAESSLIATILFNYFISMQHVLPQLLGIHNILTVNMSSTSQMRESENMYITTVTVPVTLQQSWLNSIKVSGELLERLRIMIDNGQNLAHELLFTPEEEIVPLTKVKLNIDKDN